MKDKRFFVLIGNEYGFDITNMIERPLLTFKEASELFDKFVKDEYGAIIMLEVTETEIKETKRLILFE